MSVVLIAYGNGSLSYMANGVDAAQMQSDVQRLRSDAQSTAYNSNGVFIPAKDVLGTANTIAFGAAGGTGNVSMSSSGHEFDSFARPLGNVSSDAFYYGAGTGMIHYRYLYRRPADGVAMCGTLGSPTPCTSANLQIVRQYPGCAASFGAVYFTEPNLPSIDPLAQAFQAVYPSDLKDVVVQTGYSPDVISGNRLVVYNVTCAAGNSTISEQIQIIAGNPLSTGKEPVTYTPPPISGMNLASQPNPLILGYAGANGLPGGGNIQAKVYNYHHNFTLNGVTVGSGAATSVNCGGISTLNMNSFAQNPVGSPDSPGASFPGTFMNFTASADAVGTCTATFATLSGLQPPDNNVQSGSMTIIVRGSLSISSNPSPLVICANSSCPSNPNNGTVTVSLPGYNGALGIQSSCGSYASGIPGSVNVANGTGSFSITGAAATPSGSPCTVTAVAPSSGGNALAQGNISLSVTVVAAAKLSSWPKDVELPMSGQALQTAMLQQQRNVAFYLNALLGGAVAQAALSPCGINQGRAFLDSGFTQVDANDRDPFGLGFSTDASGCVSGPNGANFVMNEPGYSGAFVLKSSSCSNAANVSAYYPGNAQGPTVQAVTKGGSNPLQSCAMTWNDQNSQQQTTSVNVEVSGCVNAGSYTYTLVGVGGGCTSSDPNNYAAVSTTPDCTPGGSGGILYTDKGLQSVSGPGTAVDNGDFTVSVSRTGIGTITATIAMSELMCQGFGTKSVNGTMTYTFND